MIRGCRRRIAARPPSGEARQAATRPGRLLDDPAAAAQTRHVGRPARPQPVPDRARRDGNDADYGSDRPIPDQFDRPALRQSDPAGSGGRKQAELVLLDRRTEKAAIDRALDCVRGSLSGILELRGGQPARYVGKTALLRHAIGSEPDLRTARAAGTGTQRQAAPGLAWPCRLWLDGAECGAA
jgi:hypothetical protein